MTGGKVRTSAPSLLASAETRALKRSSTSSNTALRPNTPCTPEGLIRPCRNSPANRICPAWPQLLVVLQHQEHGCALGGDAIIGNHQCRRQHIAIVAPETEFRIVLVAEDAGDLQRTVH